MRKSGHGDQSNSASWTAAYSEAHGMYVAMLSFSSAAGCWVSMYEISEEVYDRLGTFEDDDYKTERLIRKGRRLYLYDNDRNAPEPMEIIADSRYGELYDLLVGKEENG